MICAGDGDDVVASTHTADGYAKTTEDVGVLILPGLLNTLAGLRPLTHALLPS